MSETAAEDSAPGPRIGVAAAAETLGITVAHLREILAAGAIPFVAGGDGGPRLRVVDVERYREQRTRRYGALADIAEAVSDSPGGWDS